MRIDYPQFEVLHARARRERAEAIHRLIIAPIISLFTPPRPKAHPALRNPVGASGFQR